MMNVLLKNNLFDVVDLEDLIVKAKLIARVNKLNSKALQLFFHSS